MRGRMLVLVLVLVGLIVGGLLGMGAGLALVEEGSGRQSVAIVVERWPCTEDEPYLVGRGEYDGGTWSRYRCVHVDAVAMR
jgi:hypothetical protein